MNTRQFRTGVDVDTERLAQDLRAMADEIAWHDAALFVDSIVVRTSVEVEEPTSVTLELELTPTEDSIISDGYTIPYKDE